MLLVSAARISIFCMVNGNGGHFFIVQLTQTHYTLCDRAYKIYDAYGMVNSLPFDNISLSTIFLSIFICAAALSLTFLFI